MIRPGGLGLLIPAASFFRLIALGVFFPADAGCVPGPASPNSARMDISLKFLDFSFQLSNFNFQ